MSKSRQTNGTSSWKQARPSKVAPRRQRWQSEDPFSGRGRRNWRARLFPFLGVALFFSLLALFVFVILWLQPVRGTALVLIGAGYEDNLAVPHNAYGLAGFAALAKLTEDKRISNLRLWHKNDHLIDVAKWDRKLRNIAEKNIVLFLSLHGGADEKGAYFLPQKALMPLQPGSLEADTSRLRLTTVLDRIAEMPSNRHIVLVLDVTQIEAAPHLGMLYNSFARALNEDKIQQRIRAIPNLIVLGASGPDQRSWAAPAWGQTAFTHYIVRGLEGAADADEDGRVTALELYRYVARQVERWAAINRNARQTPVLYPRGDEGENRAREIKLSVVQPGTHPTPTQPLQFELPEELTSTWVHFAKLTAQVPSPAVYTPALWREYIGTLIRYEQLIVAGDTGTAPKLHSRLIGLGREIDRKQLLTLDSMQATLTMPAVSGQWPRDSDQAARLLNKLEKAKPEEREKLWKTVDKSVSPPLGTAGKQRLRLELMQEIIQRAARNDPEFTINRAYAYLRLIKDDLSPLPAEAHFLAMLRRDLPRQRSARGGDKSTFALPFVLAPGYAQLALHTRLLAERAALGLPAASDSTAKRMAPYAEQVLPWIRKRILAGDQQRRLGQDLLFTAHEASWKKARKLLQEKDGAQQHYSQAIANAHIIREACHLRDHVLAALPYYAHWSVTYQQLQMDDNAKVDAVSLLESLATQVHSLVDIMESPREDTSTAVKQVRDKTALVRALLSRLQKQFQQARKAIPRQNTAKVWRQLDSVLEVPFSVSLGEIDDLQVENPEAVASQRMELLVKRSAIGKALVLQSERRDTKFDPISQSTTTQQAQRTASWRGRLALAQLGKHWFDDSGAPVKENYQQTLFRLQNFQVQDPWWKSLDSTGREIGLRYQRLPVKIAGLLNVPRKSPVETIVRSLNEADRLLRQIDGAGTRFMAKMPALRFRDLQVQQLLLTQAERTYEDHWYAEDPSDVPYYRTIGKLFLGDARKLNERQPMLKVALQKLNQSGKLVLSLSGAPGFVPNGNLPATTAATLQLTTERQFPVSFGLRPDVNQVSPEGYPVVWMQAGKYLKPIQAETFLPRAGWLSRDKNPLYRTALTSSFASSENEDLSGLNLAFRNPAVIETSLSVQGLFRGQRIKQTIPVHIHPVPQVVKVKHPLPLMGSVAVRAAKDVHADYGVSAGNIVIVLDASGSMGPPKGKQFDATTKYAEATAALENVLQTLPKGTTVSLWVFGQAMGPGKTVKEAERTIQEVLPPVKWNPDNPSQLKDLMEKIAYPAIEPWNESPLMRTILRAAQENLAGATGFKTMIVITDGIDNRIEQDQQYNPQKKNVPTLLRENFRDIEINLIGFKVDSREEAAARQQFSVISQLPVPGKFYTVAESGQLIDTLKKIFQGTLRYHVDRIDGLPLPAPYNRSLDVSRDGSNDQWLPSGLPPGNYSVRVRAGKQLSRSFALSQSDLLLLELFTLKQPGLPSSLGFRRVLWAQANYPWKPKKWERAEGNWLLTMLQNQRKPDGGAQMLLSLERKIDPLAPLLQQIRPGTVWCEVDTAAGDKDSFRQRWYFQPGYPAPTYSMDISSWPAQKLPGGLSSASQPAKPIVRMWWAPEKDKLRGRVLEQGNDYAMPGDLVNRVVQLGDHKVIIDSVTVENWLVEVEPATGEKPARREKKPCLIVRITYPSNQPVWCRMHGLMTAGHEHRYFTKANKYTGIFWPVTREQANQVLRGIEIISLNTFKKNAERRNAFIEMKNLPPPSASDNRPLPPVNLLDLKMGEVGQEFRRGIELPPVMNKSGRLSETRMKTNGRSISGVYRRNRKTLFPIFGKTLAERNFAVFV